MSDIRPMIRARWAFAFAVLLTGFAAAGEIPISARMPVGGSVNGPNWVSAADVDGDGDLDLVGSIQDDSRITWWENVMGDASQWIDRSIATVGDFTWVAEAADLDGDQDIDVIGGIFWPSTFPEGDDIIWWENSNGVGTSWTPHAVDADFDRPFWIVATNIDSDLDLDILAASYGDDIATWWENTAGNGSSWTPRVVDPSADGASAASAGDIDRDLDLDIVVTVSQQHDIRWWENSNGVGTTWNMHVITNHFGFVESAIAADLDQDGDCDVIGAASASLFPGFETHEIAWWENTNGDGTAWSEVTIGTDFRWARMVQVADMDHDGDLDVVGVAGNILTSEDDDGLSWFENLNGDGSAWAEHSIDDTTTELMTVTAADLDGDGDLDLAAPSLNDDRVYWWENQIMFFADGFESGDVSAWSDSQS